MYLLQLNYVINADTESFQWNELLFIT